MARTQQDKVKVFKKPIQPVPPVFDADKVPAGNYTHADMALLVFINRLEKRVEALENAALSPGEIELTEKAEEIIPEKPEPVEGSN